MDAEIESVMASSQDQREEELQVANGYYYHPLALAPFFFRRSSFCGSMHVSPSLGLGVTFLHSFNSVKPVTMKL